MKIHVRQIGQSPSDGNREPAGNLARMFADDPASEIARFGVHPSDEAPKCVC